MAENGEMLSSFDLKPPCLTLSISELTLAYGESASISAALANGSAKGAPNASSYIVVCGMMGKVRVGSGSSISFGDLTMALEDRRHSSNFFGSGSSVRNYAY